MWKSSKYKIILDSTYESKYITASKATKEYTWLKNFIDDLGVIPSIKDPILTKYHYIWKCVEDGDGIVKKVSSKENPVDWFTNPLSRNKH